MIQANELRIGNYVNRLNEITIIKAIEIGSNGIGYVSTPLSGSITTNQIDPIPLTPEILEKCGFEKGFSEWYNKNYFTDCMESVEEMQLQVNLKSFRCGISDVDFGGTNAMTANPIQHLHQLQNLYYALTQTELIVNL